MKTIGRKTVVLGSIIWREELARELVYLGLEPADAELKALEVLQRILARQGWPASVFEVAPPTPDVTQQEGDE